MSFGTFKPGREQAMMSDINVTPMVDVMLVLLVIFIITAPLFTHRVRVDLPVARSAPAKGQEPVLAIAIDAAGVVHIGDQPVTRAQLHARLAEAAAQSPQPELQLRADRNTRYEAVAQVMSAAQSRGLTKLGFVTNPNKENKDGER